MIRLGYDPKGIFASGFVTRGSYADLHWEEDRAEQGDTSQFIDFQLDKLLVPGADDIIEREELARPPFDSVNWSTQSSGIRIPSDVAVHLENLWAERGKVPRFVSPDEELEEVENYEEGKVRWVLVNAFERNGRARQKCIATHGTICSICEFDFGKAYGQEMTGYIHVHHVKPLSQIRKGYRVDPLTDLLPVCPNCHAALHCTALSLSIEQLRELVRARRNAL